MKYIEYMKYIKKHEIQMYNDFRRKENYIVYGMHCLCNAYMYTNEILSE